MRKKQIIKIGGMSCQHCINAVKQCLSTFSSVENIEVSLEKENAEFSYDDSLDSLDNIKSAIQDEGFEVQ